MKLVAQILRSKPDPTVHAVAPTASMFDALKLMAEKNIGALLIMEGETIAGLLSERDYARKIVFMGRSSKETPVADVMTCPVMYVGPRQSTEERMQLMTEKRLRHLPVLDNGKLIGLISGRRLGERYHLRAKFRHRATTALHQRAARLSTLLS
jgi:CBS domain-containing protein